MENVLSSEAMGRLIAIYAKWEIDIIDGLLTFYSDGKLKKGGAFESIAEQIIEWASEESPKYRTPLTDKQFALLEKEGF